MSRVNVRLALWQLRRFSQGLECRHCSIVHVLVSLALWPAQHSLALDLHEHASACLSTGSAALRLGHIEQACLCVCEYVSALGQICARVSRAHACFLSRVHAWYGYSVCLCFWLYDVCGVAF